MYIWILLATIMVAFSFYNISPRADKENYINEAKTSIIVNRFKMEHSALVGTMRCEIVRQNDNGNWRSGCQKEESLGCPIPTTIDLGYTKFTDNLPIGYEINTSALDVTHYVFGLDKEVDKPDHAIVIGSTAGHYYAVSFAQIPNRWVRKDEIAPLPSLNNFLSKNQDFGTIYGWADCDGDDCQLRGVATKRTEGRILPNSTIWANRYFNEKCKLSGVPCFFAYTKLRNTDIGRYCEKIIDEHENNL